MNNVRQAFQPDTPTVRLESLTYLPTPVLAAGADTRGSAFSMKRALFGGQALLALAMNLRQNAIDLVVLHGPARPIIGLEDLQRRPGTVLDPGDHGAKGVAQVPAEVEIGQSKGRAAQVTDVGDMLIARPMAPIMS